MLLASLLAFAGTDAVLAPSGKWTVDYRADKCVASRPFGTEPITYLTLQPFVSLDIKGATLIVVAPDTEGGGVQNGKAKISLRPTGTTKTLDYISRQPQPDGARSYEMSLDPDLMAQIGQATSLAIDAGKESVTLETGKLQPVIDAAEKCNDDLMRSWGVDLAARAAPVGNPGEWFTDNDYPPAAARRHVQGNAVIVLTVDPDGRVKGCRIVATTGAPDLDDGTCERARTHARYVRKDGGDRFSVLGVHWVLPAWR
ncbi:energy transducer TonB [Sphingomonas mali]|uniref:energy transducer TonB n=1 Tax=Sphingomonas mali TaxID=40682 RepID=UPI0008323080|nr:energy transducer TonB [Sphingomonas mali]